MAQIDPNIDKIYEPGTDNYHLIQDTWARDQINQMAGNQMFVEAIDRDAFIEMLVLYNSNLYDQASTPYTEADVQKALHTIWLLPQEPHDITHMGMLGAVADGATVTSLPTNGYKAGWQYDIVTAGIYAGITCVVGDSIVAVNDGPPTGSSVINADWSLQQNSQYSGDGNNNDNNTRDEWLLKDTPTQMTGYIAHSITGEIIGTTETDLEGLSKVGHTHDIKIDKHYFSGSINVSGVAIGDESSPTGTTGGASNGDTGDAHNHSIGSTKKSLKKQIVKGSFTGTTDQNTSDESSHTHSIGKTRKKFTKTKINSSTGAINISTTTQNVDTVLSALGSGESAKAIITGYTVDANGGLAFTLKKAVVPNAVTGGSVTASVVTIGGNSGTEFVTGLDTPGQGENPDVVTDVDANTGGGTAHKHTITPSGSVAITVQDPGSGETANVVTGIDSTATGTNDVVVAVDANTGNGGKHTHSYTKQEVTSSGTVNLSQIPALEHTQTGTKVDSYNTLTTYGDNGSSGGGGGNPHFLGYFAASTDLPATANAGDFAVVTATGTVWFWNADANPAAWQNSGEAPSDDDRKAKAQMAYCECDTAAGTAEKQIRIDSYDEYTGGDIKVKMVNANTATSGVKLKIMNGSSELFKAPLLYNGVAVNATNTWNAGEIIQVHFNGVSFEAFSLSRVLDQVTEDEFNAIFN